MHNCQQKILALTKQAACIDSFAQVGQFPSRLPAADASESITETQRKHGHFVTFGVTIQKARLAGGHS